MSVFLASEKCIEALRLNTPVPHRVALTICNDLIVAKLEFEEGAPEKMDDSDMPESEPELLR